MTFEGLSVTFPSLSLPEPLPELHINPYMLAYMSETRTPTTLSTEQPRGPAPCPTTRPRSCTADRGQDTTSGGDSDLMATCTTS